MKLSYINLTGEEREELLRFTTTGRHAARKVMHARILLKSHEGLKDVQIAEHLDVSVCTVERLRKRCTLEGITAALNTKKRPPKTRYRLAANLSRVGLITHWIPTKGFKFYYRPPFPGFSWRRTISSRDILVTFK